MTQQKDLQYYLSLPYPVLLIPDPPDNTWYAKIPLLPGCMSDGETVEEALKNLSEAKQMWLEVALEDGMSISEPQPEKTLSLTLTYS
jgi:antitoxin HicB